MKNSLITRIISQTLGTFFFLSSAVVFGTWAFVFFQLDLTQKLGLLQSPRYHIYTMAAGWILLGLATLLPLLFIPSPQIFKLTPAQWLKKLSALFCLLLPIGAFLLLPQNFSTPSFLLDRAWSMAMANASNSSGAGRVDPDAVRSFILNSDPHSALFLTPSDLLIVQKEPQLQKTLQNRQIEMIGQWVPSTGNSPGEFRLIRLLMVCCAADARPIGVTIRGEAEGAAQGSWFKATGRLDFSDPNETVVLKAEDIQPIEEPEDIFLY